MSTSTQLPNAHDSESEPQGRLLVVDDDRDFAESLTELLELRGYATKSKYEFRGALALAKTFEPDVALVDIRLGRGNGLDFIADLRERHPATDCILLTAHGDVDTAIETVRRGAYDYLLKPFAEINLLISLDRCFAKRRLEREKQAAEAALARGEERYRDFIEAASDWAWEMNAEQRFTSLAGYSANATGIGSEDVVGRTLVELGMRGIDEETSTRQLQVFKERKPFRDSIGTVLSPDGRLRYINVSGKPIFDAAGEFLGFRGTANDVTNLMEREKALRESEAKFRQLAEGSIAGIHIHRKFRTIVANQAYAEIFGYNSPDEISALEDVLQLIAPHERDRLEGYRARRMAGKTAPSRYEYQGLRKDGTVIWLESHVRAVDWEGEPATQTTLIDITKQHEAERAQQESEQAAAEAQTLLLEAMESSSDGIAIYDSDDKLKLYNEAFRTGILSGISDLIEPGVRYEQLVRAAVERNLVSVPDGDVESYVRMRLEQHRRADSSVEVELPNNRWMLARDRRLPGGGFVGTRSDITDLKRARLALKESRRKAADALAMLTEAMESNPDAVAIFDADDRLTHFNKAYRTGLFTDRSKTIKPGARFEDILRASLERNLVAVPDGNKEAHLNIRLELHRQGGRSLEIELADGRWFLFSERRMSGGGTVSTSSDITERRLAELALQENEQRLRTMIENVPGVVWRHILHADGSVTFPFLSPHHVIWLGIDFDAAKKDTQVIFDRLHPDDRDGWNAAWGKSAKSLAPFHREVRIFGSANDIRWFRVRALPQKLPNGDTQWDAVGIDVTDEKRAAEVRDRMFAALENLTDAIALFGPDDRLVYTNPRYIEYNEKAGSVVKPGDTFEQILRGNVQLGRFPEAVGREEDWIAERLAARRNLPYAAERKVDSEWFDVREAALPDGSTVLFIVDITDRKAAEAEIIRQKTLFESIFESSPDPIVLSDRERNIIMANAGVTRIYGYETDEVLGKSTQVLYENKAEFERLGAERFGPSADRIIPPAETRHRRKSGEVFPAEVSGAKLEDANGRHIGFIGVGRDITERKAAEVAVRESEYRAIAAHEQLMDAIESISEGFIFYDADERLILCNSTYRNMFPQVEEMLVHGARLKDVARAAYERGAVKEAMGNVDTWMKKRLRHARSGRGTLEYQLSDGRWVMSREKRTRGGGVVGIRTDITERKRAEEAIKKNEQQLMLITENAPAMISYIGQDERYRFANSAYEDLVGVSPRQLLGANIREFWGEKIYARIGDNVKRVLAGETVNFEHTLPGKDGSKKYLAVTYVPHIVDGSVEAFFTLATDITQLVTARQALREREQRIRNILENISDGVITIDEKGKIQSFNRAAERMFGYAAGEIVGRAVSRLMPTPEHKRHPGYIRNYLESGKGKIIGVGRREVIARHKDGSTFPISIGLSEMWTGEKRTFIGSLLDMTQQEAAKEALRARDERLRQLQSELLRVNRAATIGQLSSSLTHELKQPLAAATFYMQAIRQLLKKDGTRPGKEITEIIGKVGDQVGRAAAVVGRLRPLIEKGEVEREEVDINDVVEEAVAVAALELDRKNIDLKTILGRNLPRLPVDKIQVQQVLLNLVRNAVEATRQSKRRELIVRTRVTKNGEIEVSVSDSGRGIPAELRSSIFDPFVTTRTGGTGMGLSVSRTIVEAHGGHIWASPRRGGGTIMHFNLALAERSLSDRRQS